MAHNPAADSANPVRVFLLDDHALLRRGVRDALEDAGDIVVVGESGSAREGLRRILALRPDVALLDVQLPDGSGIDLCREVRAKDPTIRALMVTTFDDQDARLAAALSGASGFVLKQVEVDELVETVRRVAAGEVLLSAQERAETVRSPHPGPLDPRLAGLTGQEARILDLLAEGLSNREIGDRLSITEKTVKNYVSGILRKLGFARRTQAAVFAARSRGA